MSFNTPQTTWNLINREVEVLDLNLALKKAPRSFLKKICFLGYCCDVGSSLAGKETDSKTFPAQFRKNLSQSTADFDADYFKFFDGGDVIAEEPIYQKTAMDDLSEGVFKLINDEYLPIVVGGSHEVSYASFSGAIKYSNKKGLDELGVISIGPDVGLSSYDDGSSALSFMKEILGDSSLYDTTIKAMCFGLDLESLDSDDKLYLDHYNMSYVDRESIITSGNKAIKEVIDFSDQFLKIQLCISIDRSIMSKKEYWNTISHVITMLLQTGKVLSIDISGVGSSEVKLGEMVTRLILNSIKRLV